jgi:hydroxymethylpyrimidine/phosphomethylpyrimidine kinase
MRLQAASLKEMGAQRVLIKGGHRRDSPQAVDLLLDVDAEALLKAPRVNTVNTHGTGCTLSSALAALRPQRESWIEAASDAKSWLTAALVAADSLQIGHGHGPVHHFHQIWGS